MHMRSTPHEPTTV